MPQHEAKPKGLKSYADGDRVALPNGLTIEVFDPAPWQIARWVWYFRGGRNELDLFQLRILGAGYTTHITVRGRLVEP